jgi:hypothetical protein
LDLELEDLKMEMQYEGECCWSGDVRDESPEDFYVAWYLEIFHDRRGRKCQIPILS